MADEPQLSHLDSAGVRAWWTWAARRESDRRARARASVRMSPETAAIVAAGDAPKGDVLGTARIAGIQAAKRTDELIPLAHPLPLTFVDVEADDRPRKGTITFIAEARTTARTGVEMEALTACTVAALTAYDMVKGLERGVVIEEVALLEKTGGKEDWSRDDVTLAADARRDHHHQHLSEPRARERTRAARRWPSWRAASARRSRRPRSSPTSSAKIEWALRHYADSDVCDLVLTTGRHRASPQTTSRPRQPAR